MCPQTQIASSLDRFQEAHYWFHMLEEHYHLANEFRWHLNAFFKAINEIPQLLSHELQNDKELQPWIKSRTRKLREDDLFDRVSSFRNQVVHREMLVPESSASVGITELRGLKLGIAFPLDPLEDSDRGMERYLDAVRQRKGEGLADFLGVLSDDDDSVPCVQREWKLNDFDGDLVEVCARCLLLVGQLVDEVLSKLGVESESFSLDCRKSEQQVRFKLYDRTDLKKAL